MLLKSKSVFVVSALKFMDDSNSVTTREISCPQSPQRSNPD